MQDIWHGDNRNGTDWTMAKVKILNAYYEHREKERNKKPKKGGKLFVIERKQDKFHWEWDLEDEIKNG